MEETMKVEDTLIEGQTSKLKVITSNMTRRAERMIKEAESPLSKSDDPKFVEQVQDAIKNLKTSGLSKNNMGGMTLSLWCPLSDMKPHEQASIELQEKTKDEEALSQWRAANRKVPTTLFNVFS